MSKHLFPLLPILVAALAMARDNPGNWTEVRTPRFTVVTNSSEQQAIRIAAQFERMQAIFQVLYPQFETDPESSIVVLAIKDKKEFRALEPGIYLSKGSLKLHGLFVRAPEKNYILMRLDAEGGNPYPVMYHEYTHLVLSEVGEWMPLWLSEGLAEFYENTEIHDQDVLLGELSQQHLMLLRQEQLLPLATLFTIDEKSPYYIREKKASIFYAESWALAHYLTLKDYKEKTSKVRQYTKLVNENVDPVAAAIRVFGDLKLLQGALDRYIQKPSFNHFKTTVAKIDDSEFSVGSITPIQAEAVEADFLACNGRTEEALSLLQHVFQQDPDNVSAQETMALLQSADETEAENKLRSAIQMAPSSAAAYDRLASFLWKHGKNLEEVRAMESTAVSLDPGNLGYRTNLANILLGMGHAQAAVEVLRTAAAETKTPQQTEALSHLLTDAMASPSAQPPQQNQSQEEKTGPAPSTQPARNHDHAFIPSGPHHFVVGILKAVHCETPNLDLTVTSRAKTVALHAENYYKVQFTALFTPTSDLKPCNDLEDRPAKVEYVESADGSDRPQLIAVELHK